MSSLPPIRSQRLIVPQAIAGALALSVLVYVILAYTSVQKNLAPGAGGTPSMQHPFADIFMGASLVIVLLAFWFPSFVLKIAIKEKKPASPEEVLAVLFPPLIIRFALFEMIAVLGLVISRNSTDLHYMCAAALVSLGGMLLSFPNESRVQEMLRAASQS